MNPFDIQHDYRGIKNFLPRPDTMLTNVEEALERRSHRQYRNHMFKLRLHAELTVFRRALASAEQRLQGRLYTLTHAHAKPVPIEEKRRRR